MSENGPQSGRGARLDEHVTGVGVGHRLPESRAHTDEPRSSRGSLRMGGGGAGGSVAVVFFRFDNRARIRDRRHVGLKSS